MDGHISKDMTKWSKGTKFGQDQLFYRCFGTERVVRVS